MRLARELSLCFSILYLLWFHLYGVNHLFSCYHTQCAHCVAFNINYFTIGRHRLQGRGRQISLSHYIGVEQHTNTPHKCQWDDDISKIKQQISSCRNARDLQENSLQQHHAYDIQNGDDPNPHIYIRQMPKHKSGQAGIIQQCKQRIRQIQLIPIYNDKAS